MFMTFLQNLGILLQLHTTKPCRLFASLPRVLSTLLPMEQSAGRRFKVLNAFTIVIMALGSLTYGYSASIISTTLVQPSFFTYFSLDQRSNANDIIGLMNSLYQAGGFFGTFTVSVCADRWGRRAGIAVPGVLVLVIGGLLAGSINLAMFIACRFLSGFGAYALASAIPLWMNEVVPAKNRGSLVAIHGASLIGGYCVAAWIGFGFWHLPPSNNWQWRAPLLLQCLPIAILLPCLLWLPESPRWLVIQGRDDEAGRILQRLHPSDEATKELQQIQRQSQIDAQLDSSYWAMLTKPSYRKRSIMGIITTVAVEFCGPIVINNYGPTIYKGLGFSGRKQFVYQGGWLTLALGGGLLSLFVIDAVPRPILLSGGITGSLTCLAVEAALIASYATSPASLAQPNQSALQAAVAMFYLYIVIFVATLAGTQFVYLGELFPTHLRAKGISLGVAGINLINVVFLQSAPTAFATIGWKYYLIFIIPGMAFAILIFFWFPDTRGVPLEEIAALFGDEVQQVDMSYEGEQTGSRQNSAYSPEDGEKTNEADNRLYHEHVEQHKTSRQGMA